MAYARAALQAAPPPAEEAEATVLELRSRIDKMQGSKLAEKRLPTHPVIAGLLPEGALYAGSSYQVHGSMSLLQAMLAGPSLAGGWCAVVGMPDFGIEAVRDISDSGFPIGGDLGIELLAGRDPYRLPVTPYTDRQPSSTHTSCACPRHAFGVPTAPSHKRTHRVCGERNATAYPVDRARALSPAAVQIRRDSQANLDRPTHGRARRRPPRCPKVYVIRPRPEDPKS